MFKRLFSQVIAGFLGRYVKGIPEDQLKVLWNGEILLDNLDLNVEAFDYLQLPFALKNGRIGKFSIKIPWKRLAWEPIIVVLEDVFLCACQRGDDEWSKDLVEKRQLAGKLAKLNAIELAKFSRRVPDNHAGQSFKSYIITKIIDKLQVSVRNVHIVYIDCHNCQGDFVFGLKFSTLTVITDTAKHSSIMSSAGKVRSGQVCKVIKISSLGIYCNVLEEAQRTVDSSSIINSQNYFSVKSDSESSNFLLQPFDVRISLLANKSAKSDCAYVIDIEPTTLAVTLNEMQLHQILSLFDYFSVCALRERYGQFRPSHIFLRRNRTGWQRVWWQYAQNAVLLDVRQKLWKTSWRNLGKRIMEHQRYVNLYKRKLALIEQKQVVTEDILLKLEEMDRQCAIDDILNYRSEAEKKLQRTSVMTYDESSPCDANEKQQMDGRSSSNARGWLNWLSLGMLGAGGTAESSSFTGVVSDDIIKDIYEATEFNPGGPFSEDSIRRDEFITTSFRINFYQISAAIFSKYSEKIVEAVFNGISVECQFCETSSTMVALIDSIKLINPFNGNILLIAKKGILDDNSLLHLSPFANVHISIQNSDHSYEPSVKVVLQPFEATFELEFFLKVLELCDVLVSFQFLHKRVLLSLNGLKDFKNRLFLKAEYISHYYRKIKWDIFLHSAVIKFPFRNEVVEPSYMLLESEGVFLRSMPKTGKIPDLLENSQSYDYVLKSYLKDIMNDGIFRSQLQDLYDYFELGLADFQMKLVIPKSSVAVQIIEKCNPIFTVRLCTFMDEPVLKPFEVNCFARFLFVRFSPTIMHSIIKLHELSEKKHVPTSWSNPIPSEFDKITARSSFNFSYSISFKLDRLSIHVDLEDNVESDSVVLFTVNKVSARLINGESKEILCLMETVMICTSNLKHEQDSFTLFSARSGSSNSRSHFPEYDANGFSGSKFYPDECCFQLHYRIYVEGNSVQHEYDISLHELDLDIYPRICGLLGRFFGRINGESFASTSIVDSVEVDRGDYNSDIVDVKYMKFGFSNFYASDPSLCRCISVDNFPFVTVQRSGLLYNIDTSIIQSVNVFQNVGVIDDQWPKIHKSSMNKRHTNLSNSTMQNVNGSIMVDHQFSLCYDVIILDIKIKKLNVHFHDSSSILGIISAPQFRSAITFQWTKCWDVLVSTEGLSLSSCWSSHEVVWGPSSLGMPPPVVNIRAKKEENEATIEISIGVQHVSCFLKAEFLALLTGYFSLPEWTFKGNMKADKHCAMSDDVCDLYLRENVDIIYKLEILESILILPAENNIDFVLHVNIPRLYCNFATTDSSENAFKDIPLDCMVRSDAIANKLDIINLFGRNLSLSVVLVKDEADSSLNSYISNGPVPFIQQFDADLWLRIPCQVQEYGEYFDFPALIMMRVDSCNVIGADEYLIIVLEAALDVADQFSLIGKESEYFRSDALQFMLFKEQIKEGAIIIPDLTFEPFIIMKICIKSLSISFSHLNTRQPSLLETMAKVYVRLDCSAILQNSLPRSLSVDIYSLLFHSFLSDVLLASFASDGNETSFFINFSRNVHGEAEIIFSIPALDIWLHWPDWDRICTLLGSFKRKLNTTMSTTATPESSPQRTAECHISLNSSSEIVMQDMMPTTVKSESITISFHLPIWDKEEKSEKSIACQEERFHALGTASAEDVSLFQSKPYKHLKLILQSKFCKLGLTKDHLELKCNIEKMRAILEMVLENKLYSLPFIYMSQVKLKAEIHIGGEGLIQVFVEVQIDSTNVALSYQIFKFWSHSQFKAHGTAISGIPSPFVVVKLRLTKGALLLSDGRGNFHGPILEMLMKNLVIQLNQTKDSLEGSGFSDVLINYNNIDKVIWEPLIESWSFQISLTRKEAGNIHLEQSATTICIESTDKLNLNVTEPLIEAIFRLWQMVTDALNQSGEVLESLESIKYRPHDEMNIRRYAPYILCNETSLPLKFHVLRGPDNAQESLANRDFSVIQPGISLPIYVEETFDEQFFRHRSMHSSELLIEKKLNAAPHHMISIFFDGTFGPSIPMSMDLVGRRCFEMNISNTKLSRDMGRDENASNYSWMTEEKPVDDHKEGLEVPVVFEVSMLHYSKMIRLYSTVMLLNSTSIPLELRFDIPFGVSPKILDPILPGQEIPLPLHLAETGRIRWHPVGKNYLWSEAQLLSNILLQENRPGFFRSFVCYPTHPSSDPLRCCISVQDFDLSMSGVATPLDVGTTNDKSNFRSSGKGMHKAVLVKEHLVHQIKLTAPLLVKNYLPVSLSLLLETGGVKHSLTISEGNCTSFFAVDSMHDLELTYQIEGYKPVISKFPRAESFSQISKSSGSKYFLIERHPVYPYGYDGPLSVTIEKTLDASCGARQIAISVLYLLYNCTGLLLAIVNENQDNNGIVDVIPSCYQLKDHELQEKQGLAFLSYQSKSFEGSFSSSSTFTGDNAMPRSAVELDDMNLIYSSNKIGNAANSTVYGFSKNAKPYMYSPLDYIPASDLLVRLAVSSAPVRTKNMSSPSWSIPFPLFPVSGSANVTIPKPSTSGAFLISSTSIIVAEQLSGRTRVVTFQPRYIICNACKKDLSYKQKGTNNAYCLRVGEHSHLQWSDTSRDLLVSLRFMEMGWQWSGSFLPDHVGDIQVKMRNHVSGELNIVRVEVQNADFAFNDEKVLNSNGSSSTQLILLSDDKNGFIPYRIDNFSTERLRIYQQKCESVETVVLSYTSVKYAWDEPFYPHRIVIEVPGERIVGTYNLDNVQDYVPVYLRSTSEKPERKLYVSVHAEEATKVLSIFDSSHIVRDMKGSNFLGFKNKRKSDQRQCHEAHFSEVIKIHFPFIGISLMSSSPQELIFACARETTVVLMQSSEQQKILSQILSLQIDNQLSDAAYPIIASFDNENKGRPSNHLKTRENLLLLDSESAYFSCEPVVYFSAAKWRKPDASLISFEYICLRLAPLCFELEEQILLYLFEFLHSVNSRVQRTSQKNFEQKTLGYFSDTSHKFLRGRGYIFEEFNSLRPAKFMETGDIELLPFIVPLGAPWQQIYLLARRQKKIYVEVFELAPIKLSLSFSSTPLITRAEFFAEVDILTRISSNAFQRGIMALADVEGVPVHLRQLRLEHLMASPHSIQDILVRHYMRQLLYEIYKLFGSAGVIGNPIGFARNVKLGIKDFLSVSSRGTVQSPLGLFVGIVQGSKSIFSNTIYALSSAATQFSKAAHKGIVAFTFEEETVTEMDKQLDNIDVNGKGVLNEFLEGLTGLLQSPIKGAEKHGLPGVISGIAMGTTGFVARPVASILQATAKTAQSIRNRSSPHQSNRRRIRLPRPLARELPLSHYSWEEAIGVSMLQQADMGRLKKETCIMCTALRKAGKFVVITERLVLAISSPCLIGLGTADFAGVPSDMPWVIEMEMSLESVVHVDRTEDALNIVGSDAKVPAKHRKGRSGSAPWRPPVSAPFVYMSLELAGAEEAEGALQVLLSAIELGKERRWGVQMLHRSNLV